MALRPSSLKPGVRVACRGRILTFVRRIPNPYPGRQHINLFTCPDFVGLNGPADRGLTEMSDAYCARHCTRS